MQEKSFKNLFDSFYAANQAHFGLTEFKYKENCIVFIITIMSMYKNMKLLEKLENSALNEFSLTSEQAVVFYIDVIQKIISAYSQYFSDSHVSKHSITEDVHCVIYLIKYLVKSSMVSRQKKEKKHDVSAIPSEYYKSTSEAE